MSVSTGVAVGASVGSALAGILIALAVAVFFMIRKEKRRIEEEEEIEKQQEREAWCRTLGEEIAKNPDHILIAINQIADFSWPLSIRPHQRLRRLFSSIPFMINNWVSNCVIPCYYIGADPQCLEKLSQCPVAEFERLAGQVEDWQPQIEKISADETICAFVGRVLAARMDENCDLETTLLPPAILQIYKHVSAYKEPKQNKIAIGGFQHLWRSLTVRWYANVCPTDKLSDDDPRLPNIIALEELLVETLACFNCCKDTIRSEQSRAVLRDILTLAAELALMVFQSPEPSEFYWPENYPEPGNRRIVWFPGIKEATCIPESYRDKAYGMEMKIQVKPLRCKRPLNPREWANTDESTQDDLDHEDHRLIDNASAAGEPCRTPEDIDRLRAELGMPPLKERLNYPLLG